MKAENLDTMFWLRAHDVTRRVITLLKPRNGAQLPRKPFTGMSPLFDQRNSDGHPQRFGTNDPAQRKSTQLSTDTNGAAENMVTKVVSNAENALDQMKRDTIRMGQLGN